MLKKSKNSFQSLDEIKVSSKTYKIFNLKKAEQNGLEGISKLPKSLKVLLENLLRHEDDITVNKKQIVALKEWLKTKSSSTEIAYRPARVLMQDYTGIPAVADLAAMRDAVKSKNIDPKKINPLSTVDLVIDHSVMVDAYATKDSFTKNVAQEFSRNGERYSFLKWGQKAFNNFRVVPPGTGICHQVNLEYLSKVVWSTDLEGESYAYPDTLVGTDSHTTMVNGLSVLGWGVGGIEAEAAMLGQPISMLIPEVVGFEVNGKLTEVHAALGLANFKYYDEVLLDRKRKYELYKESLTEMSKIRFQVVKHGESNYSYFSIILDSENLLLKVEKELNSHNIFPRRYFYPSVNMLNNVVEYSSCPVSEDLSKRILCLPLYWSLETEQVRRIAEIIRKVL